MFTVQLFTRTAAKQFFLPILHILKKKSAYMQCNACRRAQTILPTY